MLTLVRRAMHSHHLRHLSRPAQASAVSGLTHTHQTPIRSRPPKGSAETTGRMGAVMMMLARMTTSRKATGAPTLMEAYGLHELMMRHAGLQKICDCQKVCTSCNMPTEI